ncbi:MAG: hypothetical protein B7Y70_07495, partial [Rhizobiales bacterium 35-68-8]
MRIMSIRRENLDLPLADHALRPILRTPAETAGEGARRHLHPHPAIGQATDEVIGALDPFEPLGMGDDGHIARQQNAEHKIVKARRHHVVRRLNEHVAGIAERQEPSGLEAGHEVGHHMIVRTRGQIEGDALVFETGLKAGHGGANALAGI